MAGTGTMAIRGGRGGEPAVRKGPWTLEEDLILVSYISHNGEGSWDNLACAAGLNRNGKSCRLRWLNYLRPGVRRGSITADEETLIRELHARLGNKWSKIAKHLPGRTDNEIKNYWRTRIQTKQDRSQKQQPYRELATATAPTAASEGASSSALTSQDSFHGWTTVSDRPAASYFHKAMAATTPMEVVSEGASSALKSQQECQDCSTTGNECMKASYAYPYYSELSAVADQVKVEMFGMDAPLLTTPFFSSEFTDNSFWNVVDVDRLWETVPATDAF